VLEAVFVLLEFSSPSRRIFIGSHSLPPSLVRRIGPSNITIFVLDHNSLPIGDPSTLKQSYLQSYISKIPYLLYLTIICVCLCVIIIITVVDDGLYTHTTSLIDALFILGHGVERVSIDIHCLVSCNSEKWPC
jgi:hypothetical protein